MNLKIFLTLTSNKMGVRWNNACKWNGDLFVGIKTVFYQWFWGFLVIGLAKKRGGNLANFLIFEILLTFCAGSFSSTSPADFGLSSCSWPPFILDDCPTSSEKFSVGFASSTKALFKTDEDTDEELVTAAAAFSAAESWAQTWERCRNSVITSKIIKPQFSLKNSLKKINCWR